MKKPFYLIILTFAIVTLAGGCIEYKVIEDPSAETNQLDTEPETVTEQEPIEQTPVVIGGDRDSHGCPVGAGYQYCPSKESCVRVWEEDCDELDESGLKQKFATADETLAADGVLSYISSSDHYQQNQGSQIYIAALTKADCAGCFSVTANYKIVSAEEPGKIARMTAKVDMENWNVTNVALSDTPIVDRTANECVDIGGQVVVATEGGACKYQEAYVGNISDRIEQNICCK
jgi:hypothetical protein